MLKGTSTERSTARSWNEVDAERNEDRNAESRQNDIIRYRVLDKDGLCSGQTLTYGACALSLPATMLRSGIRRRSPPAPPARCVSTTWSKGNVVVLCERFLSQESRGTPRFGTGAPKRWLTRLGAAEELRKNWALYPSILTRNL